MASYSVPVVRSFVMAAATTTLLPVTAEARDPPATTSGSTAGTTTGFTTTSTFTTTVATTAFTTTTLRYYPIHDGRYYRLHDEYHRIPEHQPVADDPGRGRVAPEAANHHRPRN